MIFVRLIGVGVLADDVVDTTSSYPGKFCSDTLFGVECVRLVLRFKMGRVIIVNDFREKDWRKWDIREVVPEVVFVRNR